MGEIAASLNICPEVAYSASLAHERGHALAYFLEQDFTDEVLAWEYAEKYFGANCPKLKMFALSTYNLCKR